jgi:hypothetical protein
MTPENRKPLSLIVSVIIGFLFVSEIAFGIYAAKNVDPSGPFYVLYYLLLLSIIGYWLEKDSRTYNIKWVYDMGFFLYFAWPFIIIYYLFKTRKSYALYIVFGYIGLFISGNLLGRILATEFLGGRLFPTKLLF